MKRNSFLSKTAAMAAIMLLGFTMSCQQDETPLALEASYIAEEAVTDAYFEDTDDMAGTAVAAEPGSAPSGKVSSSLSNDDRFCVNVTVTVTISSADFDLPKGDITLDFGDGCTDPRGNTRTGKILIHFEGRRFLPGSFVTVTFDGYTINGIALTGVRTLTNISGSTEDFPKFKVELAGGSATWPDGTVAEREHCFEREWIRASNPLNDQLYVSQCNGEEFAATGSNRRGIVYQMIIIEQLVYKRGCPIAVSGVKKFILVSSGREIVINYGDGECDRIITITVGGDSRSVDVRSRG